MPADYKPYVPVAKRRAQLKSTLTGKQQQAKRTKVSLDELQKEVVAPEEDGEEEKAREKLRRERTLLQAAQEVKEQRALAGEFCPTLSSPCPAGWHHISRQKVMC